MEAKRKAQSRPPPSGMAFASRLCAAPNSIWAFAVPKMESEGSGTGLYLPLGRRNHP